MSSFLGEAWLANTISLIMGILGTIAFFMQTQKKVKPIIIQYGDIIFNVTEKESSYTRWIDLNSIEINLSISNLKNAVGIMEDIFVRIYTTDSYQPETVIYFANKLITDEKENDFTPFIMSPNSNVSMKVVFGQVEHSRSEKSITLTNHYVFDIFYKLKGEKRAHYLNSIFTYNNGKIKDNKVELTNLSMNIKRDKYYKVRKKTYRSTYNGIVDFFVYNIKHYIKYNIFYFPKCYVIGFFQFLVHFFIFMITNVFAFCISKKIIIYEGKRFRQMQFSSGDEKNRLIKDNTLNKIFSYIEKIINEMNKELIEENKITIVMQEKRFILCRFGVKLDIYSPGDSSIYAQVLEGENRINLRFEIKESKWGIKYWSYEDKFITQYNMAIKILNYFTMLSIIKR